MNYVEYGKENRDTVILLHGGGLSWWNYREVAELLQEYIGWTEGVKENVGFRAEIT